MPLLGFGTYLCSDTEAEEAVLNALQQGYRHIDTAEGYHNEAGVGRAIKRSGVPREDIFITTKLSPGGFGKHEKTYQDTIDSFARSLAALDAEYVDLYLIHHAFASRERVNQWRALLAIQASGKARAIGVSNWGIKHLGELIDAGLPMPSVNQIEYHPMCTHPELLHFMKTHDIVPFAYSSLAPLASWREGKPGASAKQSPPEASSKESTGEETPVISAEKKSLERCNAVVDSISQKHHTSPAQVLLRWAVQQGVPVIPKSLHVERMVQNAGLFDWTLDETDMAELGGLNENRCFAWPIGDPINCE